MSNQPTLPAIQPSTAAALCLDPATGEQADRDLFAGAPSNAAMATLGDWVFCHSPESGRTEAIDEEGNSAYDVGHGWEAY